MEVGLSEEVLGVAGRQRSVEPGEAALARRPARQCDRHARRPRGAGSIAAAPRGILRQLTQLSAISYQLSAISYQLSAISYQLSASSCRGRSQERPLLTADS
ncbi:MAG: hypothetical protein DMG03_04920 [Acidobacteria bacterium]|nr:MAG: hypothetical protein DMG03_04920 [Acidobacteriota bacterium]